jgi:hypothetical protein
MRRRPMLVDGSQPVLTHHHENDPNSVESLAAPLRKRLPTVNVLSVEEHSLLPEAPLQVRRQTTRLSADVTAPIRDDD